MIFNSNQGWNIQKGGDEPSGNFLKFSCGGIGWWLTNHSNDVFCTVNQEPLLYRQQIKICDEDIIEWGLSIWQIGKQKIKQNPAPVEKTDILREVISPPDQFFITKPPVTLDLDWFDTQKPTFSPEIANPFDLITLNPDEQASLTAISEQITHNKNDVGVNIIAELSKEYEKALYEPQKIDTEELSLFKNDMYLCLQSEEVVNTTLTSLNPSPDPILTLQDMVTGVLHIDDIVESLDNLGEFNFFKTEETPELLWLFAPKHLPHNTSKSTSSPFAQSPLLTRREHHYLSADSHFRLSQQQFDSPEEPSHEQFDTDKPIPD